MNGLNVPIPPEMEGYRADLEYFFQTMVRKLHTNRHKGVTSELNVKLMLKLADGEMAEVRDAIQNSGQFETAVECADVANFMFLAASAALQMTRDKFKELKE